MGAPANPNDTKGTVNQTDSKTQPEQSLSEIKATVETSQPSDATATTDTAQPSDAEEPAPVADTTAAVVDPTIGTTSDSGNTGADGAIGTTGSIGETGTRGETGSIGDAGTADLTGATSNAIDITDGGEVPAEEQPEEEENIVNAQLWAFVQKLHELIEPRRFFTKKDIQFICESTPKEVYTFEVDYADLENDRKGFGLTIQCEKTKDRKRLPDDKKESFYPLT